MGVVGAHDGVARPPPPVMQLARAHSTGHSLAVRLDRDLERSEGDGCCDQAARAEGDGEMVTLTEHNLQTLRGWRDNGGDGSSRGGRSGLLAGRVTR